MNNLPPLDPGAFDRLRRLKMGLERKTNRHEMATVLITAAIHEGMNTRARIVGVLRLLGFNYRHAAIILKDGTGDDPKRFHWQRHPGGRYSVHPDL